MCVCVCVRERERGREKERESEIEREGERKRGTERIALAASPAGLDEWLGLCGLMQVREGGRE